MKFILKIALIFLIGFSISSCKKEKNTEPAPVEPPVDGSASNATEYYGILSVKNLAAVDITDSLIHIPTLMPNAVFSSGAATMTTSTGGVEVDSVVLNSLRLTYDGSYQYEDLTSSQITGPFSWKVAGRNTIPGFTYTNTSAFPLYSDYALLPDTTKNSKPFNFILSGFSNADKVIIVIAGNSSTIFKELNANSASLNVSFTSFEMANFSPGENAGLFIWFVKNDVRNFGGKAINFTTEYFIRNSLYIN